MKIKNLIAFAISIILSHTITSCNSVLQEPEIEPAPIENKDDDNKTDDGSKADNDDEYDSFEPYSGPIEPLSDEILLTYTDGKRWIYDTVSKNYPKGQNQYEVIVHGDIVFDTAIVYSYGFENPQTLYNKSAKIVAEVDADLEDIGYKTPYYFEEDGVTYNIWKDTGRHEFYYIWDINPSEFRYITGNLFSSAIISKGTITLMGKVRRAVKTRATYGFRMEFISEDYWVEGIGSLFGQESSYYPQPTFHVPANPYAKRLRECYDGDKKIYDYREFKPELYIPEVVFID